MPLLALPPDRRAPAALVAAAPLALALAMIACGSPPSPAAGTPAPAGAPAPAPAEAPAPAPGGAAAEDAPFATPNAPPPPPPAGAVLLRKPALYVQRCDPEHSCPRLLQPAGEAHCRELELGGITGWRLPDLEEARRFADLADLAERDGFHWTRSAYAEDDKQAWIVDPASGQSTTIPRDRKPFIIRCVIAP